MYRLISVTPLEGFRIAVKFQDGTSGTVDLSDLAGQGVFSAWNDPEFFRKVSIGPLGEAKWDDAIDLCPDSLYLRLTGKNPEDIFPSLARRGAHA